MLRAQHGLVILDGEGWIRRIINNYARILQLRTHSAFLAGKKQPRYTGHWRQTGKAGNASGHGSALAQAYNHKDHAPGQPPRQIHPDPWGIRDFEHRFGRQPEECGCRNRGGPETLALMAELGIRFTILSVPDPAFRKIGETQWRETAPGAIDHPSLSGQPAAGGPSWYFSNGEISQAIAFENLLSTASALPGGFWRPCREPPGPAWSISPPTARPTGTTMARTGPGLRPAPHRSQRAGPAHQLRRIPGAPPAGV